MTPPQTSPTAILDTEWMELLANEPLQHALSEPTRLEKRINDSKNLKLETLLCVATSIFERKIQPIEHGNEAAKL